LVSSTFCCANVLPWINYNRAIYTVHGAQREQSHNSFDVGYIFIKQKYANITGIKTDNTITVIKQKNLNHSFLLVIIICDQQLAVMKNKQYNSGINT